MLSIEGIIFVRNDIALDTCSPVGKNAEAPFAPISYWSEIIQKMLV